MRNTAQRDTVLKVVEASCDHPSAETIYTRCREIMPEISLGTVYRNLKVLVELGKIREVSILNAGDRYDKTVGLHAHFRCKRCGCVLDVPANDLETLEKGVESKTGFQIDGTEVLFVGVCDKCRAI
ncbi:MAG: transcriptional repressor [Clostridia bacterium]|nr:transcriptional repressor [Clostridia bacterium]MBR3685106.1 transcriptional repressor [Clostridia bacterium]